MTKRRQLKRVGENIQAEGTVAAKNMSLERKDVGLLEESAATEPGTQKSRWRGVEARPTKWVLVRKGFAFLLHRKWEAIKPFKGESDTI